MAIEPILSGDLGQRYVVKQRFGDYEWRGVAWSDSLREAEALLRHHQHDLFVEEIKIIDRYESEDHDG